MNHRFALVILGLLLVITGAALAQQENKPAQSLTLSPQPPATVTLSGDLVLSVDLAQQELDRHDAAKQRMYEDIEIMRRILDRGLARVVAIPRSEVLPSGNRFGALQLYHNNGDGTFSQFQGSTAGNGTVVADLDNDGYPDLFISNGQAPKDLISFSQDGWAQAVRQSGDFVKNAHSGVAPFEAVEGFYLKGHGVVFTAALAVHFQETIKQAPAPTAKPLSEWERTRKELRGEKHEAAKNQPQPKHDSVTDVLLKILAANGQHFSQLPENENVSVALTLRQGQNCLVCHKSVGLHGGSADFGAGRDLARDLLIHNELSQSMSRKDGKAGPTAGSDPIGESQAMRRLGRQLTSGSTDSQAGRNTKALQGEIVDLNNRVQKTETENLTLLGDLSMKQGKYKEAFAAYLKALNEFKKTANPSVSEMLSSVKDKPAGKSSPSLQRYAAAVELASKLAQASLAMDDPDGASKALQQVGEYANRLEAATKVWKEARRDQAEGIVLKAAPVPLPAKLIISAPKKLLDQIGTEKISFAEFKKAVSVQYLNFASAKR